MRGPAHTPDEEAPPTAPGPSPPAIFALALLLMVALAVALPGGRPVPGGWRVLGLLPVGAGAGLHWWAWRAFRRRDTTVRDAERPRTLVTGGPYRLVRNPMYLGGILILAGSALLLGAWTPFVVVPAYAWVCHRIFVAREEETLAHRFGDAYDAYRERVGPWL